MSLRLVPSWIANVARFNPVHWAESAGRIAVQANPTWGTIGSYAGFLAIAAATAFAATKAFRTYQRSI